MKPQHTSEIYGVVTAAIVTTIGAATIAWTCLYPLAAIVASTFLVVFLGAVSSLLQYRSRAGVVDQRTSEATPTTLSGQQPPPSETTMLAQDISTLSS